MSKTTDIRDLDVLQITEALKAMGEPSFRAKQIHQWLWQKGARSFEEMTNLSKPLREKLAEAFKFHVAKFIPLNIQKTVPSKWPLSFTMATKLKV